MTYITADPWGNNEQNASLFIHGFSASQLGYTLDGVPLGDQQYGNYNGLSPQRAVISEDVSRVIVSTGAGDLGVASTSNLGGAIETFSADPQSRRGGQINHTFGSYGTARTFVRLDSGAFGDGNAFYVAGARQRARAFDFNGIQGGYQANGKFVHDGNGGKLTLYLDYSDKIEPNEDSTTRSPTIAYQPALRPFLYPDFAAARAYIDANGSGPAAVGGNYQNYYSDAQRTDYLGYVKHEANLTADLKISQQIYYHHNDGVGVVAGPLGYVYSNPIKFYYPGQTQAQLIANNVDNSGYIVRTTEYRIDREGYIAALSLALGDHKIEFGGWYEHNSSAAYRRWYALDLNNPQNFSPYIRPSKPLFTQYGSEIRNNVVELHLQDDWKATDALHIQAGVKSSLQFANGYFTVQPIVGSLPGSASALPNGKITTQKWFLPSLGATWQFTPHEQLYVNAQKNLRQYVTYGGGGVSPWSVGSQAAFNTFAQSGSPESSWTYEIGLRSKHQFDGGVGFEAQINYYHVDFSNRLLGITAAVGGIAGGSISGGTPSLVNVGDVHTNGVDAALTLRLGKVFSLYSALSYNSSKYASDYSLSATTGVGATTGSCIGGFTIIANVVPTCGKQVPGSPQWLYKSVATVNYAGFEAQLIGDYVGKRFATYTDDQSVPSFFLTSLRVAYQIPTGGLPIKKAQISLNVTNLFDVTGYSTVAVGSPTNTYNTYPIPPRQYFGTLSVGF